MLSKPVLREWIDGWVDGYICIEPSLSKDVSKPRFYPPTVNTSSGGSRSQGKYPEQENFLKINSLTCIYFGPFAYQQ